MIIGVAPHSSNGDFVLGLTVAFNLRLKISFFGKHSLFIPSFSRLLRRFGGIPIERSTKHGVVDGMADKMRDAKSMVLCLAPEGTRSPVSSWKTGFLHIAHKSNVPLFLVAFDYKKKLIEFGPTHNIGDNIRHELNRIYLHFKQVQGKYPEKMITKIIPPVERKIER
jgi:1-acyl-sn-glycerol-3-phosphate acyltransferase